MKTPRSLALVWLIFMLAQAASFGQNSPQPEVTRTLLRAKKVYIITGHVRYYKTKAVFKRELVDETPFDQPCRNELEKWGRFTLAPDVKSADLVIRAYEKGDPRYVPVASQAATETLITGTAFLFLDVWQPSSKRVIWYASKNLGTSWSTNTAVASLVQKLREYIEAQEKSAAEIKSASSAATPQN